MQGLQCSGLSNSTLVGPTRLPTISSTSQGTPPPSVSFLGLRSSQSNLHGDGATSISLKQISQKNVLLQIGCGRLVCNAASSQNGNDGSQTEKMIVAITGATGFIGSKLVKRLAADGHEVRLLTRSASKARSLFPEIEYPSVSVAEESLWAESIQGSTGVVNLAGPPISTRWTPEVKADLKNCRLAVTAKVVEAINSASKEKRPAVLVSSTAVGFYGTSETSAFDETSPSGKDYLAEVCKAWEAAARRVSKGTRLILVRTGIVLDMDGGGLGREWEAKAQGLDSGTRLVLIRTGIVLDKDGGALAKMVPMFSIFAGGPLGSGKQWLSWVHRDDLVSLIMESLQNPAYEGVINGTAPNPVRMTEMCDRLGNILGRPSWLPVPEFALKAIFGEGASVVLEGQRVLPKRAQELGFSFKYRYISDALKAILTA